jgi:hypothetical protein
VCENAEFEEQGHDFSHATHDLSLCMTRAFHFHYRPENLKPTFSNQSRVGVRFHTASAMTGTS